MDGDRREQLQGRPQCSHCGRGAMDGHREALQGWLLESFDLRLEGWQLRQLHPGTRITHYRCFLPDLAEFASYRRERTDGAAITDGRDARNLQNWRRERDSNPRNGLTRLHTFQACSFNRSDTSPHTARRTNSTVPA